MQALKTGLKRKEGTSALPSFLGKYLRKGNRPERHEQEMVTETNGHNGA